MDPKEGFGVFVREFGLVLFFYGLYAVIHMLLEYAGVKVRLQEPFSAGVVLSIWWTAAGAILIFAADQIAAIAYRARRN
jgi:hypothetical protein